MNPFSFFNCLVLVINIMISPGSLTSVPSRDVTWPLAEDDAKAVIALGPILFATLMSWFLSLGFYLLHIASTHPPTPHFKIFSPKPENKER